jgi:GTP-binding protein
MKFVDQVKIHVKAGDGGDGCVAFRREKYIERGGPSGGDGGKGGDVVFVTDPQLTTLLDFSYQPRHFARDGQGGLGSDCNGRDSDDHVVRVPIGTVIKDQSTGEQLFDLSTPGERLVIAKGGKGGLGNMNFATSVRQAPRFAEPGIPGEEKLLTLELKLLADVGIVGYPNAGKSSLVSRLSKARPKIADYPFTTLVPQLGMVAYHDKSFVLADIPGLIEGASEGVGLGHQFLRHVERCRVLIHLVDCGGIDPERTPLKDFDAINRELKLHSPELADKPQVVAGNKLDLTGAAEIFATFQKALKRRRIDAIGISAATGEGLAELLDRVAPLLFSQPVATPAAAPRPADKQKSRRPRTLKTAPVGSPKKKASGPKKNASRTQKKASRKASRPKRR